MTSTTHKPPPSAISTFISSANTKSPREALAYEILHNLRYQHRWSDLKVHSLSTNTTNTVLDISSATISSRPQSPPPSRSITSAPSTTTSRFHTPTKPYPSAPGSTQNDTIFLVSGLPPRTMYMHPDLQKRMVRENIADSRLQVPREWVLPLSIGEKWTLKRFCTLFTALPDREPLNISVQDLIVAGVGMSDGGNGASHTEQIISGDDSDDDDVSVTLRNADGEVERGNANVSFTWQDKKRVFLGMLAHNGMGGDGTIAYYIMQEGEVKPRQNG